MERDQSLSRPVAGPAFRSIALPAQHGGWSFVLEPVLIGVLLAPTLPGLLLGTAALMVFLLDQPLRVAVKDWRKGKRYGRTRMGERFALIYSGIGILALLGALWAAPRDVWLVLLLAAPLALIQLSLDLRNQARSATAEIAGSLAFAAAAPAIVLMASWPLAAALGLWAALALRVASAILYVRARLRLEKGKRVNTLPAQAAQFGLVGGLALLAWANLSPWLALAGGLLMAGRGLIGLSRWRKPLPTVQLGIREVLFGLAFAACLVVGTTV